MSATIEQHILGVLMDFLHWTPCTDATTETEFACRGERCLAFNVEKPIALVAHIGYWVGATLTAGIGEPDTGITQELCDALLDPELDASGWVVYPQVQVEPC